MKIPGFDQVSSKLSDLVPQGLSLDGIPSVPLNDLLTPDFVAKHTKFANAGEMFGAGGFSIKSMEDLKALPGDKINKFISSISSFGDLQSMLGAAGKVWTEKKVGM